VSRKKVRSKKLFFERVSCFDQSGNRLEWHSLYIGALRLGRRVAGESGSGRAATPAGDPAYGRPSLASRL